VFKVELMILLSIILKPIDTLGSSLKSKSEIGICEKEKLKIPSFNNPKNNSSQKSFYIAF
jgi:hypothetical protein